MNETTNTLRVGVVGVGQFAPCFIPLFQAHPGVKEVVVVDAVKARAVEAAEKFGLKRVLGSFDELLASDVDAVAILTQRWMHAPMAMRALRAGKHVYSAVPAAVTLEELEGLIEAVRQTGRTYMLGETSYYYGTTVFVRQQWDDGVFGRFVYGEGEYLHDMSHGFYGAFQFSGGKNWKQTAGFPPMLYPTHSVSMITSVTGARMTHVSCLGQVDEHEDGIFREGGNLWGNAFSNQTALFRTSDGGMARMNEFRRVGASHGRSVRLSLFGTQASFEEQGGMHAALTTLGHHYEDVTETVRCGWYNHDQWLKDRVSKDLVKDFATSFAGSHERERQRLPSSFNGLPNGHEGSHQFLVDDFVKAALTDRQPPNHVWAAAAYNAPGIVAHQSARRNGELLSIPDLGWPDESRLLFPRPHRGRGKSTGNNEEAVRQRRVTR